MKQVVDQILKIPHLLPRLLSLLPFCSPINDLLLVLLRVSRPPSPLIPSAVTQSVRMLDPFSALGKPGHVAAEELLRGIIELCSAVSKPQLGGPAGFLGPAQMQDEPAFEWRDTALARQIAEEKTVKMLLDWMLAEVHEVEDEDADSANPSEHDEDEMARRRELRTSSLVTAIAVLVDLIRKNNSDFVEQQMLAWARRKESEALEKEMLEADGAPGSRQSPMNDSDESGEARDDRGPSVVDLGAMLTVVADRIGGLQALIRKPRSSVSCSLFHSMVDFAHIVLVATDCSRQNRCRSPLSSHPRTLPNLRTLRRTPPLFQHVPPQSTRTLYESLRLEWTSRTRLESCRRPRFGTRRTPSFKRRSRFILTTPSKSRTHSDKVTLLDKSRWLLFPFYIWHLDSLWTGIA